MSRINWGSKLRARLATSLLGLTRRASGWYGVRESKRPILCNSRSWTWRLETVVQLLSCIRLLRPHGQQNARLPCPSPSSGACSSSSLGAEVLTKRRRGTSSLQQDWGCSPAPPHGPWQPQAWGGSASLPLPGGALSTLPRLTGWEAGWRPQPHHQVTSGSAQLWPPTSASSWLLGFELGPEPILLVWASNPLHKLRQLPSSKVSPPNAPPTSWLGGDPTWTDHFGAAVYLTLSSSCCWKTPSGVCAFHPRRCEELTSSSTFKLARCHPSPGPHHSDHDGCPLHKGDPYLLPVTHVLMPPSATARCCCCLVTKSRLTLCNTTDWSTPGPSVISACFTGGPFFALPLPPRLWSLALDSSYFWHLKEDLSSGGGLVSSCERTRQDMCPPLRKTFLSTPLPATFWAKHHRHLAWHWFSRDGKLHGDRYEACFQHPLRAWHKHVIHRYPLTGWIMNGWKPRFQGRKI